MKTQRKTFFGRVSSFLRGRDNSSQKMSIFNEREKRFVDSRLRNVFSEDFKLKATAKKAIELIVKEAKSFTSNEVEIISEGERFSYKFATIDGRTAIGEINVSIREVLRDFLSKSEVFVLENGEILNVLNLNLNDSRNFKLSWGKKIVTEKAIEPKPQPQPSNVFQFPRQDKEISLEPPKEQPSLEVSQKDNVRSRILIVEDDTIFYRVLERFLDRYGIDTIRAENGEQALKMLEVPWNRPELIVSDVHMPNMNGFEFLKKIRSIEEFNGVSVIMLTSDDDIEVEIKLLSEGADAFVGKNEDPRKLCIQVQRLLGKLRRKAA